MEENKKIATKKMGIFLGAVLAVGVLYLIYFLIFLKNTEKTENAYIHGNKVAITSQVSGVVQKLDIENTERVDLGKELAAIDDFYYKIALKEAEAKLGESVRDYYASQKNVIVSENALNTSLASLKVAEKTYNREKISHNAGITSSESFDKVTSQYIQSKNNYEESKAKLEIAKIKAKSTSLYTYPEVVSAIENYKKAYSDLQRTKIASPVSGVVADKQVEIGQDISAGQTMFTVVDLKNIWVEANFKENQLKHMKHGNPVKIKSDLNGKTYEGIVVGISAGSGSAFSLIPAQNATGNWVKIVQRVPVRIEIKKESLERNGDLPLGTSLIVKVDTSVQEDIKSMNIDKTSKLYKIDEKKLNEIIDEIIKNNSL